MPPWVGVSLRRLREAPGALVLLLLILSLAAVLRWNNLEWDQGHVFHPDERFILMTTAGLALPFPLDFSLLLSPKSPLNPHSFAYGSLPFYLLKLTAHVLAWLGATVPFLEGLRSFSDFDHLRTVGRFLSGLFDLGSIVLVYLIGSRLRDRRVGLLAAAMLAVTVINIQYSHFYASDTILAFFVLLATLFSIDVLRTGSLRAAALTGVAVGLGVGSKFSAMPILAVVVGAQLLRIFVERSVQPNGGWRGLRWRRPRPDEMNRGALGILVSFLCAGLTFVVVEPYAVIDFVTFTKNIAEQNDMVRGIADLPYTRQYANTPAFWYFTWNILMWGMGVPLGLFALAGSVAVIVKALRRPQPLELLLLAWVLPYFAITGSFHSKFLRYLLPLTPFLCLLAAYAFFPLRDWLRAHRPALPAPVASSVGNWTEEADQEADVDESDGPCALEEPAGAVSPAAQEVFEERLPLVTELPGESFPEPVMPVDEPAAAPLTSGEEPAPLLAAAVEESGAPADHAVLSEEEAEARRWAELKGLGLFDDYVDEPAPVALPVAAATLAETGTWSERLLGRGRAERAVAIAGAVALIGGLLHALAFSNIYSMKHTAVRASEWIYQNVPKGSKILTEHWEEGMPVPLAMNGTHYDSGRQGYKNLTFEGYQPDAPAKFEHIVQRLSEADYIVFFSNRLYDTIPRLPRRYPITTKYYQLLFGEELGFKLEAYFTAYPSALGVTLVEDTFGDPRLPVPAALASYQPTVLTILAGKADESFSVYDHPKVLVFKKERSLSAEQLRALFGPVLNQTGVEPGAPPSAAAAKPVLMNDARRAVITAGGSFRDLFNREDVLNRIPLPVWIILVELLGVLGLPLAFTVFHRLSDRGFLLAKPLGILALAWINWMIVGLGLLPNTRGTSALALLLLALCAAYFGWRQRAALLQFWHDRRRDILAWEAVFWAAFALFLLIRLANPDLWHPARGGEKPMDLAYLMAAIRSATFPPYDPWFAGGYLNYYYYGQIVVGTLIRLSGIVPTVAYNLVVPLLFALTAGGAFSAAYNLMANRDSGPRVPFVAGVGAAVVAVVFGNLGGAIQLIDQVMRLGPPALRSGLPAVEGIVTFLSGLWRLFIGRQPLTIPTDWYWASTRVLEGTINEFPFFTFLYADLHAHMIALPFTLLALGLGINLVKGQVAKRDGRHNGHADLGAGNLVPILGGSEDLPNEANSSLAAPALAGARPDAPDEVSAASGVEAAGPEKADNQDATQEGNPGDETETDSDATAFEEPVVAALIPPGRLSLWAGKLRTQLAGLGPPLATVTPEMVISVLATGLIIGALMPINSWDFPTYIALYGAALLAAWYLARPLSARGLLVVALKAVGVLVLAYALYSPFHSYFQQWYTGVDQFKDKSNVWGYLRIHGFFLFAIVSFLFAETARQHGRSGLLRAAGLWLRRWDQLPRVIGLQRRLVREEQGNSLLAFYGIAATLTLVLGIHLMGMTLVAILVGLLVWTAYLALHRDNSPERLFVLVLVAAGLALGATVEIVAIKGDVGRMNTVFKFYLQVWILWSVAAVACLYYAQRYVRRFWPLSYRRLWLGAAGVLIAASLVYPMVASRARVADRYNPSVPLTLDGTAYMATATFNEQNPDTKQSKEVKLGTDLPAMLWLQDNVAGTPVILEGWAPLYRWGARYSIYTGLPTVIGWDWHQKQQRWGYQGEIDRRLADVRTMYNDASVERAVPLLAKYEVRYIIVGDLERAVYGAPGLAKFDQMVGDHLEVVYDNQGVKIFRRL